MLVIRLSRTGRKKLVSYRVVAADSRRSAKGKVVDQLGHYNPHTKDLVINQEKVAGYIKNGAQPSSRMVKLLKQEKVTLPKWAEANLVTKKKAPKSKKEAPAAAPAAAKPEAAPTAEAKDAKAADAPTETTAEAEAKPEEPKAEAAKPAADEANPEKADEKSAKPAPDKS